MIQFTAISTQEADWNRCKRTRFYDNHDLPPSKISPCSLRSDDRQQSYASDKSLGPPLNGFLLFTRHSMRWRRTFIPRYILSARSSFGTLCVDSHFFERSLKQPNPVNPLCPDFGWTSDATKERCSSRFSLQAVARKATERENLEKLRRLQFLPYSSLTLWSSSYKADISPPIKTDAVTNTTEVLSHCKKAIRNIFSGGGGVCVSVHEAFDPI